MITKKSLLIVCVVCLTAGCGEKKKVPTTDEIAIASKKLNDWFQQQWDVELAQNPVNQTYLGIKTDYDKWNDLSKQAEEAAQERRKSRLAFLEDSVDIAYLNKETLISYKLGLQQTKNEIADYRYRLYDYPINQMFGYHSLVPSFLINMHQITNKSDAKAYISRLNGVAPMFDQVIALLKEREAVGVVPPKFVFPKVIESSKYILTGIPFEKGSKESTLFADFNQKLENLNLADAEKGTLQNQAREALVNSVKPAYEKLIGFLEEQEKRATEDDGVWKFKDGLAFYDNALKRTTTTSMTAAEIHELGLTEVSRIHNEMEAIRQKVGFEGDLKAFFKFMKEDKQFYYPDTESGRKAYMQEAVRIIDSMRTRLDELFVTKPKADIVVKQVEAFREKSAGKAFYQPPAVDGSRPGTYYANLYDISAMPKYQMEALAYHEGIPGHHMQLSIAQELENLPMFRKFARHTAYIEGWGLYTEFIPKEMGFYSDPYSDFGRLAMELWRACRLVVDTGIHAKKWTRDQGIAYYLDNTPNAESDAVKMAERHIVMPSQATAYKIGMNKILEIRQEAKQKLGGKFDIREFHDVVLTNGAIPLNILEEMVNEWVGQKL